MSSEDGRDDVGEDSGAVGGGVADEVARETPGAVVKQPKPLRLGQPRMDVAWKRFEKAYDFYARATKLVKKDPEIQAAAFMSILGDEVDEIYENFNLTEREASDVDVIKRKFRNYFAPKENEVYESYVLRQMQQDTDESVDQFVTRVAAQARNCNYPSMMIDRMTRDQIVIGVNNLDAREKLLEIENLTLDKAVKICKAHEKASKQTRLIAEDIKAVSVVRKRVQSDKKSKKDVPSETSRDIIECKQCGRQHVPGNCLSSGKKCYKCNEKGHFARVCKQKRKKVKNIEKKSSESDEDDSDSDGSEEIQKVWALSESKNSDQWKVTLECQGRKFQAKIDTGAECNVISRRILRGMDNLKIMPSRVKKLVAYNGGVIEVLGKVKLPCEIKGRKHEFWFQVIKGPKKTILDGKSAIQAGLLARIDDLKACQDLFRGLGCVKGFEYDIDLVEHPQFKVHAARQIPHSMREDVKRELDKMVKQKVIERCEEAADCVSPLVVVKRNGKIRLCIDLTDLNVNVKRRHFPLRGIEEISSRIEGKIPLADTLSRDCEPIGDEDDDFPEHLEINTVLCMGAEAESKLVQATQEDEVLQKLKKVIKDGWPNSPKEVPGCLRAFFTFREELAYVKDVIFKGDQCVIPESERKSFLKLFHHGHCGIQATLRRARDAVFWPGMTKDITEMIESCQVCQQTQRKPQKETVLMKPVPELPFQLVAMDLFAFKGRDYIILADSFSGYFDFKKLSSTTSRAIIDFCKEKFAEHGIPQEVHSDGGPQFTSREFRQFSRDWGFARVFSSPYFARSNGFVERYVQTAKKILKRCEMDGHDVKMALLMERNTRREGLDSPSERLFGRKTRNPMTLTDDSLKPCWISDEAQKLRAARQKQKKYADRSAVDHKPLQRGEKVRVLDGDIWVSGTVKAPETERSYHVHLDDGRLVRRNSSFLKPTKVTNPMMRKKRSITVDYDSEPDVVEQESHENTVESETEIVSPNVINSPKSERMDGPVRIGRTDGAVTTRSGRIVKKPERLNL
uniref:RNA-directed DNA polymerase n=1 Tax=Phlebotomus papatasi TaxID=29031 RepID=A0A1B0CZ21_PHLPP